MQLNKKLLIFSDWYEPGYKAGGPIRSIVNLVACLKDSLDIYIVTTNQDFEDPKPYPHIIPNVWTAVEKNINVLYFSKEKLTFQNVKLAIKDVNPKTIYINSIWSLAFSLYPLLIERGMENKIFVLAPRGMLHEGAMKYKKLKKVIYIFTLKQLNIFKKVRFQATDDQEYLDIKKWTGCKCIHTVSNFPCEIDKNVQSNDKIAKSLRLVFISRISPKKNLLFLIQQLGLLSSSINVILDVFGPPEEVNYFIQCKDMANRCGQNISINFWKAIEFNLVKEKLYKSHFFILPTFGENFGHAIFESFAAGRPVIISDQTPWRDLKAQKVGFDIPLNDPSAFVKAIEYAANMNQKEFDEWCDASLAYAKEFNDKSNLKEKYLRLFS